MHRVTPFLIIPALAALPASVWAGGECPVDSCACISIDPCVEGETIDLDIDLTISLSINATGCGIASSFGGVGVGVATQASSRGETMGDCPVFDTCSSDESDSDSERDSGPLGMIQVSAHAESSTTAAITSADAFGSVDATSLFLGMGGEGVFSGTTTRCPTLNQVTTYEGRGFTSGGGGGGFSTTFDGPCTSISGMFSLTLDKRIVAFCDPDCPDCDHPDGMEICTLYVRSTATFGSALGLGDPPPPTVIEGVYGIQRDDEGTISTIAMGFFDDRGFDPIGQEDTLDIEFPIDDGTSLVMTELEYDAFPRHDGDINGDGALCPADRYLMSQATGSAFGDDAYAARADFDLDGMVDDTDVDAFFLALDDEFAPVATCDCPTDIDDSGDTGFSDLLLILANWGPCGERSLCFGDVDGDEATGFSDLLLVLAAWGDCP